MLTSCFLRASVLTTILVTGSAGFAQSFSEAGNGGVAAEAMSVPELERDRDPNERREMTGFEGGGDGNTGPTLQRAPTRPSQSGHAGETDTDAVQSLANQTAECLAAGGNRVVGVVCFDDEGNAIHM